MPNYQDGQGTTRKVETNDNMRAELIFVTNITNYIRGEKSVMWKNFRFL